MMTGPANAHSARSHPPGEGELTAQLISAAVDSPEHLSQEEVDRILGVRPGQDEDRA